MSDDLTTRRASAIETSAGAPAAASPSLATRGYIPSSLLSALSHELRGPLGTIVLWTELLKQGAFDPAGVARALGVIERGARSLEHILEDLLDLSRLTLGSLSLDRQSTDLLPVLNIAVERTRPVAEEKGVALTLAVAGPLPSIMADAPRILRSFTCLIQYALRLTRRGEAVAIEAAAADGGVELRVEHGGSGLLPDNLLQALLEEGHQATAREVGLGVAVASTIVGLHGGRVAAVTSAGTNAIQVWLPGGAFPLRPGGEVASLTGRRVLVVDDAEDARDALRLLLERWGAVVYPASSVEEAMAALGSFGPDVILSDVAMPGADGYELIRRVRALSPAEGGKLPAAVVTAFGSAEDRVRALAAGYQEHVSKPVDPERLRGVLNTLLHPHPAIPEPSRS